MLAHACWLSTSALITGQWILTATVPMHAQPFPHSLSTCWCLTCACPTAQGATCFALHVTMRLLATRTHPLLPLRPWFSPVRGKHSSAKDSTGTSRSPSAKQICWRFVAHTFLIRQHPDVCFAFCFFALYVLYRFSTAVPLIIFVVF